MKKPREYWTKERCLKAALKCKSRKEFADRFIGAYESALRHGWMEELCGHMKPSKKPTGFWNSKTECAIAASDCESRNEFCERYPGAYSASKRLGFYEEITKHMKRLGNRFNKLVYVYEFPSKFFYVGLTHDIDERNSGHKSGGSVYKHRKITGDTPKLKIVSGIIPVDEAAILEGKVLEKYIKKGWIKLNVKPTGGIGGGHIKWTYDACKEITSVYETGAALRRDFPTVYGVIYKRGWKELLAHMIPSKTPDGTYTFNVCEKEALMFLYKKDFKKYSYPAYQASQRNGWLKRICKHMIKPEKECRLTLQVCKDVAFTCKTPSELKILNGSVYSKIYQMGWKTETMSHMEEFHTPKGFYSNSKENCHAEALMFRTRTEFRKKSNGAYNAARENGWLDDICKHMETEWEIKPVKRFTNNGKIKTYPSIKKAADDISAYCSPIIKCCQGKRQSAYGYKWEYAVM